MVKKTKNHIKTSLSLGLVWSICWSILASIECQAQNTATSLLWKVEGKGMSKPSYVYGTMHSKKKSVYEFNESVLKSLESCDGFVGELALEPETMLEAQKMLQLPEGKTLSGLMNKKDYALAETIIKRDLNLPIKVFDKMQPAYLYMLISSGDLMNGEMKEALDQYLYNYAKQKGKKTGGLETLKEQVAVLGSMPLDEQVKYFVDGMKKLDKDKGKMNAEQDKLVTLYLKTDIEGLAKLVNDAKSNEIPKTMKDALVGNRNKIMADRFSDLIAKQSTFAAVGAAHLGGTDGIVTLLRNKGFTLTPIPFKFDGTALKYASTATAAPVAGATSSTATQSNANADDKSKSGDWVFYNSEKGHYTALFPTVPTERAQNTKEDGKEITTYLTMTQDMSTGKTYGIAHTESDKELKGDEMNDEFGKKIQELGKPMNMKVTNEQPITQANMRGKEYTLEAMGVVEMKVRMFAKGKFVYRVLTTYMLNDTDAKLLALKFLESFNVK